MACCDKPQRVGDPCDRGSPLWASRGLAHAKSQVIDISDLQAVRYTLEKLFLPWLKKKIGRKASLIMAHKLKEYRKTRSRIWLTIGYGNNGLIPIFNKSKYYNTHI